MNVGERSEAAGTTGLQAITLGLLMHASPVSAQAALASLIHAWAGLGDWTLSVLQLASLGGVVP